MTDDNSITWESAWSEVELEAHVPTPRHIPNLGLLIIARQKMTEVTFITLEVGEAIRSYDPEAWVLFSSFNHLEFFGVYRAKKARKSELPRTLVRTAKWGRHDLK